jgi:predicted NAD-dependent protein-ADP-ribosyltransferase YbiA (DUF1768 family)
MVIHYDISWLKARSKKGDALKYIFFWGHARVKNEAVGKSCFSQWYPASFIVEGITYKTAEHWMMAQKALLFGDSIIFQKIVNCEKRRGKRPGPKGDRLR